MPLRSRIQSTTANNLFGTTQMLKLPAILIATAATTAAIASIIPALGPGHDYSAVPADPFEKFPVSLDIMYSLVFGLEIVWISGRVE